MQQFLPPPYGPGAAGFNPPLRRFGAATRTAQTIGIEWFDYAKQSHDDLTVAVKMLAAARTPAQAFAVQAAFLRESADRFAARSRVLSGLYMTLAADLAGPGRAG